MLQRCHPTVILPERNSDKYYDKKIELPIHTIIGASEDAQIKTKQNICFGNREEPAVEYTAVGLSTTSGGRKTTQNHMLLTTSKKAEYAELCQLDVLGLKERKNSGKGKICQEFKDQRGQSQKRWYKTSLLWKTNSNELPTNKIDSLARLGYFLGS